MPVRWPCRLVHSPDVHPKTASSSRTSSPLIALIGVTLTAHGGGPFRSLHEDIAQHLKGRSVFVRDTAVGADPHLRSRRVSFPKGSNLFVSNMFIRLEEEDVLVPFPEWTVICAFLPGESRHARVPTGECDSGQFYEEVDPHCGSAYTGEIKKACSL